MAARFFRERSLAAHSAHTQGQIETDCPSTMALELAGRGLRGYRCPVPVEAVAYYV